MWLSFNTVAVTTASTAALELTVTPRTTDRHSTAREEVRFERQAKVMSDKGLKETGCES